MHNTKVSVLITKIVFHQLNSFNGEVVYTSLGSYKNCTSKAWVTLVNGITLSEIVSQLNIKKL